MKIAYLAPEIPALSATFVYKEILTLKTLGTEVVPFSVHRPSVVAGEAELEDLKQDVIHLYEAAKWAVFIAHLYLLLRHPLRYLSSLSKLIQDMVSVGLFSRNALGLVFRYFYAASLAKQLLQQQCQHIHVHFAHVPTDIAMYASALSGVSYSVTAHANDIFERGWLLKQKVARSAFFATISEFNKRYLSEIGVDASKLKIVRCGVDDTQFERRAEFVSGDKIKVGVVGRLVEKKGIDTLILSIKELKQQKQNIALYIAGSGPLDDELTTLVKECGLNKQDVVFLGALPNGQVAEFISSLDVFVLPCKMDINGDMDGIPVVLMEAMLSGVPVISTKISGIPELVIDRETGLLVKPDNADELASAISNMTHDDVLRDGLIQGAVEVVTKHFSLMGNTRSLNEMFKTIIAADNKEKGM